MTESRLLPPVHPGEILRGDLMTPLGLSALDSLVISRSLSPGWAGSSTADAA